MPGSHPPTTLRRKLAIAALALVLLSPVGTLIHELGHCAAAVGCGAQVTTVGLAGGLILYPRLEWRWSDYHFGWIEWRGNLTARQVGAVNLSGSGATWLIAIIASALLLVATRPGPIRTLLRILSLYHFDGLSYTFLPQMGLRHGIFFGGPTAEPLEGAIALGAPALAFEVAVVLVSVLCTTALVVNLRRGKNQR